jgi:branched-chain amino acid transport system substrate-binding protein
MKKLIILIILLFILSGCNKTGVTPVPENNTIKLGIIYPQTGQDKIYGEYEGNGYILAAEEINASGGINGKKIELIVKDDFSSREIANTVTTELIEKDKVLAVLGSFSSSTTIVISEICRKNKIPLICSSSAVDDITTGGNHWVFRLCAPSRYYSITSLDFIMKNCPVKTMGILYGKGFFSLKTVEYLRYYAQKKGIKIVTEEEYSEGMVNFKPILKRIKMKNPDLLYAIAYTGDAPLVMKQSRQINLNPKVYIGAGIGFSEPDFITMAGKDSEYMLVVTQWDKRLKITGNKEFVENYEKRFDSPPDYHSALTYSGLYVLADALKRSKSYEKDDIKKALKETSINTIVGKIDFENYDGFVNQNKHKMVLLQIQKGEFIPVYPPEAIKTKIILPVPPWSKR